MIQASTKFQQLAVLPSSSDCHNRINHRCVWFPVPHFKTCCVGWISLYIHSGRRMQSSRNFVNRKLNKILQISPNSVRYLLHLQLGTIRFTITIMKSFGK